MIKEWTFFKIIVIVRARNDIEGRWVSLVFGFLARVGPSVG
jgi:hypothetical protein